MIFSGSCVVLGAPANDELFFPVVLHPLSLIFCFRNISKSFTFFTPLGLLLSLPFCVDEASFRMVMTSFKWFRAKICQ